MANVNISVLIAAKYDEKDNSITSVIDEFDYDENGNDFSVVFIVNGCKDENSPLEYDFFIRKLEEEKENTKNKFMYLFSAELDIDGASGENGGRSFPSGYPNGFFSIGGENVNVSFAGKGYYELEVFQVKSDEEKNSIERYREYRENNITPAALYCFEVK